MSVILLAQTNWSSLPDKAYSSYLCPLLFQFLLISGHFPSTLDLVLYPIVYLDLLLTHMTEYHWLFVPFLFPSPILVQELLHGPSISSFPLHQLSLSQFPLPVSGTLLKSLLSCYLCFLPGLFVLLILNPVSVLGACLAANIPETKIYLYNSLCTRIDRLALKTHCN